MHLNSSTAITHPISSTIHSHNGHDIGLVRSIASNSSTNQENLVPSGAFGSIY